MAALYNRYSPFVRLGDGAFRTSTIEHQPSRIPERDATRVVTSRSVAPRDTLATCALPFYSVSGDRRPSNTMHPTFAKLLEGLHPKFEELLRNAPGRYGNLPKTMPKQGVYLFSEGGNYLYVGRSNKIRLRYGRATAIPARPTAWPLSPSSWRAKRRERPPPATRPETIAERA
jgi:hypothetical protein